MQITLETLRNLLRNTFGRNSFIASFVTSIQPSPQCSTASINQDGELQYNPSFVQQHVQSESDLFCLLVHELLHPMFGHFVYTHGKLENIAADSIINSCITQVFGDWSDNGSLFRMYYRKTGLQGILRPESDMNYSRYAEMYRNLYPETKTTISISTGEVIRSLKVLADESQQADVTLLGSHGNNSGNNSPIKADTLSRIADNLHEVVKKQCSQHAGSNNQLSRFLLEVLDKHRTLKKTLLEQFTTKQKLDKFKGLINQSHLTVSPIPITPSKRDLVLLAAEHTPFHFHNQMQRPRIVDKGLAIYLDVSGSVQEHLPKIVGILQSLRTNLTSIYLFSNQVVEVPFADLLKGHIETTYGTDFDCVAESILNRDFDKAIVITDGYASMCAHNLEQLQKRSVKTLTILFGESRVITDWDVLGDVVQLDEVIV